jgi:hypothetical protein
VLFIHLFYPPIYYLSIYSVIELLCSIDNICAAEGLATPPLSIKPARLLFEET